MLNLISNIISGYVVRHLPPLSNDKQSEQNQELVKLAKEEYRRNELHRNRQRRKSEENLYAGSFTMLFVVAWGILVPFSFLVSLEFLMLTGLCFLCAKLEYANNTNKLYPTEKNRK